MAEIYYVYEHVRLDTNEVFYVGKGKHNRVTSKNNRNKHWQHIVESVGYTYRILLNNIDEITALSVERETIKKYRNLNFPLVNYTDGGEGVSGMKHSKESKRKMSELAMGRVPHNKGKKFSEEICLKISLAKTGKPASNKGVAHTKETKEKMSAAKVGVFKNKKWWTNGIINVRAEICPGAEWYNGQVRK
jgi:hypothetical protein